MTDGEVDSQVIPARESLGPALLWHAFIRPRATIQKIVASSPEYLVLPLAGLAGISNALDRASLKDLGDRMDMPTILALAVVVGPFGGLLSLYLFGALLRFSGKWIGGKADQDALRAALAWGSLPLIASLAFVAIELAVYGNEVFRSAKPAMAESYALTMSLMSLELVFAIWSLVLILKMVGQVQRFSAWKALLNVLLAAIPPLVLLLVVIVGARLA